MNNTMTALMTEPAHATSRRYQVYRQAKTGLHYNHGPIIDTPEEAVALFLHTAPAFEGGGLRLWDHYEQQNVASAEWCMETTGMGFTVRHRINVFHDPALAVFAAQITEREQLEQNLTNHLRAAV